MVTTVLFGLFAVLLLIGAPIAICLGMSSVSATLVMGAGRSLNVVLGTVPQLVSAAITKSVLMAIPFFILGGNIMEKSGISTRLIKLAQACVGHFKGGVAMVCVLVACFFAAISGSGPATVAALGRILIPAMIEVGYSPAFAAALMATAGAIGVIIPPSITFVVYGSFVPLGAFFLLLRFVELLVKALKGEEAAREDVLAEAIAEAGAESARSDILADVLAEAEEKEEV